MYGEKRKGKRETKRKKERWCAAVREVEARGGKVEAKCHIARDEIAIVGVFRRDWNLEWPPQRRATVCGWEARNAHSLARSLSLSSKIHICSALLSSPPLFLK